VFAFGRFVVLSFCRPFVGRLLGQTFFFLCVVDIEKKAEKRNLTSFSIQADDLGTAEVLLAQELTDCVRLLLLPLLVIFV